ncbi:GNAT family N-acetyltransferase [Saccharibacillus kuerlensis]|uniref:N-acetyltransferase domain-containing protein n=1 Tax=Saccharibacillus kuerlensis TaxID=459527 RepID=A0ABQ2LAR0_9BACL|nr:GNAT family N-acetyltransferase [Saccharibacillus kuerlensis]GGO08363.1 hypothetical protein GCM10010969_37770 [Saccharibacillus kuerlensis]
MITIRFASQTDIPHIQSVARDACTATYSDIYPKTFIENFLNMAYSAENLQRSIERDEQLDNRSFLVAEWEGEVVGYAQTAKEGEDSYELLRIYIQPEYQHRGIGQRFLRRFLDHLAPSDKLFAWVAKENVMGRAFYEKNGFKHTEEMSEMIEGKARIQLKMELDCAAALDP